MSESASILDQETARLEQADADKKAHEAAVEKAKAEGDPSTGSKQADKPASKASKTTGDSA